MAQRCYRVEVVRYVPRRYVAHDTVVVTVDVQPDVDMEAAAGMLAIETVKRDLPFVDRGERFEVNECILLRESR